ncbi:MAG: Helix-turn-helix protein [Planctomycetota bacterium]|nr:Helix-turn-helix protein [Planctomycetota bacterium]
MRFEEKLRKQMLLKGFNQQRLARASRVSDSEVSRILSGKSANPGLENALKLARAVGVSLDYLADDAMEDDSPRIEPTSPTPAPEAEILETARELGLRQARRILETVGDMGYEVAIRRLLEIKPLIEIGDQSRPATLPQPGTPVAATDRRASSA